MLEVYILLFLLSCGSVAIIQCFRLSLKLMQRIEEKNQERSLDIVFQTIAPFVGVHQSISIIESISPPVAKKIRDLIHNCMRGNCTDLELYFPNVHRLVKQGVQKASDEEIGKSELEEFFGSVRSDIEKFILRSDIFGQELGTNIFLLFLIPCMFVIFSLFIPIIISAVSISVLSLLFSIREFQLIRKELRKISPEGRS